MIEVFVKNGLASIEIHNREGKEMLHLQKQQFEMGSRIKHDRTSIDDDPRSGQQKSETTPDIILKNAVHSVGRPAIESG